MRGSPAILPASDRALLVSFSETFSPEAHRAVRLLTRALEGVRGVLNLHPAYVSVLVDFDPRLRAQDEIEKLIRARLAAQSPVGSEEELESPRIIEVPVVYGGECGPDLADVAAHTSLALERVVELHSAAEYEVCFIGFATSYPYLSGLPPELATPRLSAPRKLVPAGSVAIGGSQAGIYTVPSPGGWRILGRTPMRLFDPLAAPPPLLRMGDRVRFLPVAGDSI
jgi:KipI family sensor histidine kinase inhibitor